MTTVSFVLNAKSHYQVGLKYFPTGHIIFSVSRIEALEERQ